MGHESESIEAKLAAYIDGELDAAGRADIERTLAATPRYRVLLEQLSRTRQLLQDLPRERAPADLMEGFTGQLERAALFGDDDRPVVAGRIGRWMPRLAAAASIGLLAIGLGVIVYYVLPTGHAMEFSVATPLASGARLDSAAPLHGGAVRADANAEIQGTRSAGDLAVAKPIGAQPDALARSAGRMTRGDSGQHSESIRADARDAFKGEGAASYAEAGAEGKVAGESASVAAADAVGTAATLGGMGAGGAMKIASDRTPDAGANRSAVVAGWAEESAKIPPDIQAAQDRLFADDSGAPVVVVVTTHDISTENRRIENFFAGNGIAWSPGAEAMPAPLSDQALKDALASRMNTTRIRSVAADPKTEAQVASSQEALPQQQLNYRRLVPMKQMAMNERMSEPSPSGRDDTISTRAQAQTQAQGDGQKFQWQQTAGQTPEQLSKQAEPSNVERNFFVAREVTPAQVRQLYEDLANAPPAGATEIFEPASLDGVTSGFAGKVAEENARMPVTVAANADTGSEADGVKLELRARPVTQPASLAGTPALDETVESRPAANSDVERSAGLSLARTTPPASSAARAGDIDKGRAILPSPAAPAPAIDGGREKSDALPAAPVAAVREAADALHPRELLRIETPTEQWTVLVDAEGRVRLGETGEIPAAGRTCDELAAAVAEALEKVQGIAPQSVKVRRITPMIAAPAMTMRGSTIRTGGLSATSSAAPVERREGVASVPESRPAQRLNLLVVVQSDSAMPVPHQAGPEAPPAAGHAGATTDLEPAAPTGMPANADAEHDAATVVRPQAGAASRPIAAAAQPHNGTASRPIDSAVEPPTGATSKPIDAAAWSPAKLAIPMPGDLDSAKLPQPDQPATTRPASGVEAMPVPSGESK